MRKAHASDITVSVIDGYAAARNASSMLGTRELLDEMAGRGISRADIARVLRLAPPRVTEMYKGERKVSLDEGKRLVEHYGLDDSGDVVPLSEPVSRLLVLHVAQALKASLSPADQRLEELAQDLRAFSRFAADHQEELSTDAASGFLRGRQSDQPTSHRASRK